MQTFGDIIELLKHRRGATPDTRVDLWGVLNQAGHHLHTGAAGKPWYHSWSWAKEKSVSIDIPANTSSLDLPQEFGELLKVTFTSNTTQSIVLTTLEHIAELQRNLTAPTQVIYIAYPKWAPRLVATRPAAVQAEIYPVRDTATTGLNWVFTRRWRDHDPGDPKAVPNILEEWERLYIMIAREMLAHYEFPEAARGVASDPEIAAEIDRLVRYDRAKQFDLGAPARSVMRSAHRGMVYERPFTRITR